MKTFKLILAVAVFAIGLQSNATIINVNNASPSPGQYSGLQDAIDAALAGDSIYLAATNLSYGNVVFNKQLHFFGPGYIVSNGILGNRAIVGELHFTTNISGSSVTGIEFSRFYADVNNQTYSNLSIQRCIITDYLYIGNNTSVALSLEGNVFTSASFNTYPSGTNQNSIIRNNIFNGSIFSVVSSDISNNIILGLNAGAAAGLGNSVTSCNVVNNIFIGRNTSSISATNSVNGNLSFAGSNNAFPGAGVNLVNIDPAFVSAVVGLFAWSKDYTLAGGSPAIGAGAGGVDLGVYDGEGVYRKDGEPAIPIIRSVNVPGGNVVPANSSFNINIISESHE